MTDALKGRVVLVTGGGRGIGRAHSLEFAREGAQVVVNDLGIGLDGSFTPHETGVAYDVAAEIADAGGSAIADTSDISTFEGGAQAVAVALETFGRIDIVVNNAGQIGGGGLEDLTEVAVDAVLRPNYFGTLATTKAAWPFLCKQNFGRIINTVSEVALDDRFGSGLGYANAKAAVWSATLGLAQLGRPHGITVNALSPGAFTRMNEAMFRAAPSDLDLDPVHVARLAAWLASEGAADVSGKVIHVAAGEYREYRVTRHRDTELMDRVRREIPPVGGARRDN
jgi:NAD(P)-dependent dehydrogenase (short-subunit alcohol dehydrogenase family)